MQWLRDRSLTLVLMATCVGSMAGHGEHDVGAWYHPTIPTRPPMSGHATVALLKTFLDAFNRHDLDAIMEYFADDCVFYMPRGAGPRGDCHVGKREVRAGLATRFEGIPNVHYGEDQHWACGDLGVSEWTLTGTTVAGKRLEVRGVDLLQFLDGKITRKDSFWKIVE